MSNHPQERPEQPLIHFAGAWIPAHMAWKKMAVANVVADVIERFNTRFPHLASPLTRDVVPLVRKRLKEIELLVPAHHRHTDSGGVAGGLLQDRSAEEVVARLRDE